MPVGFQSPSVRPPPRLTMWPSTDVFSKLSFSEENNYLSQAREGPAMPLEGHGVQDHTTLAAGRRWGPVLLSAPDNCLPGVPL